MKVQIDQLSSNKNLYREYSGFSHFGTTTIFWIFPNFFGKTAIVGTKTSRDMEAF
jgi:hypothetical protein